jgi:cysteine desulfurase
MSTTCRFPDWNQKTTITPPDGVYLDNNATTMVCASARQAMSDCMEYYYGNPSSKHFHGAAASIALNRSREIVKEALGTKEGTIIFTSGGTEANNLAILGLKEGVVSRSTGLIGFSRIEHKSVFQACLSSPNDECITIPAKPNGEIDVDFLLKHKNPQSFKMVCMMLANNETGVIQPLRDVGNFCEENDIQLHVDAVQAIGKMKIPEGLCEWADSVSISAHKFHGPKGVGALWVRDSRNYQSIIQGGGQEKGLRPGTENLPGIVGMAAALVDLNVVNHSHIEELRNRFEEKILAGVKGAVVNGKDARRVCNTSSISFTGSQVESDAMVYMLSMSGVHASAGAACNSTTDRYSEALMAMGMSPENVARTIRFSLSSYTTEQQINTAAEVVVGAISRLSR